MLPLQQRHDQSGAGTTTTRGNPMKVRDEVCGMELEAADASVTMRLDGKVYYFCGERCKRLFKAHPDWYVPIQPGAEHG